MSVAELEPDPQPGKRTDAAEQHRCVREHAGIPQFGDESTYCGTDENSQPNRHAGRIARSGQSVVNMAIDAEQAALADRAADATGCQDDRPPRP
jgi:hypothetical protein